MATIAVSGIEATPESTNSAPKNSAFASLRSFCRYRGITMDFNSYEDVMGRVTSVWTCLLDFRDSDTGELVGCSFFNGKVYPTLSLAKEGVAESLGATIKEACNAKHLKTEDMSRNHRGLPRQLLLRGQCDDDDELDVGLYLEYIALSDETPACGHPDYVRKLWRRDDGLELRCKNYATWQRNFLQTPQIVQNYLQRQQAHIKFRLDRKKPDIPKSYVLYDVPNTYPMYQSAFDMKRRRLSKNMVQNTKTPDFILFDKNRTRIALDTVKYLVLYRGCTLAHASIAANAILSLHHSIMGNTADTSAPFTDKNLEEKSLADATSVLRATPREDKSCADMVLDIVRDIYGCRVGIFSDDAIQAAQRSMLEIGYYSAPTRDPQWIARDVEEDYERWANETPTVNATVTNSHGVKRANVQVPSALVPPITTTKSIAAQTSLHVKHNISSPSSERPLKKRKVNPARRPPAKH